MIGMITAVALAAVSSAPTTRTMVVSKDCSRFSAEHGSPSTFGLSPFGPILRSCVWTIRAHGKTHKVLVNLFKHQSPNADEGLRVIVNLTDENTAVFGEVDSTDPNLSIYPNGDIEVGTPRGSHTVVDVTIGNSWGLKRWNSTGAYDVRIGKLNPPNHPHNWPFPSDCYRKSLSPAELAFRMPHSGAGTFEYVLTLYDFAGTPTDIDPMIRNH
jgi:hypothetical protein